LVAAFAAGRGCKDQTMANGACRWRVLIAEDDVLFAATVDDFLTQEGFCVSISSDGKVALEAAARSHFDALLTDLRMPNVDGVTLIRRLRAERPTLPVVVMSGHAPSDWRTTLQHEGEGPLVLLDKPVRMHALVHALRKVLGQQPMSQ
jgi:DNA-binding response OmpR family regulator